MSKRRRTTTGFVPVRSSQRPIDKELKMVVLNTVGTTQRTTTLKTTTFPCTVTGLRWSFTFLSRTTTDQVQGMWAIVLTQDGESVNSISLSDGGDMYTPEQNVLAFGSYGSADVDQSSPSVMLIEGSTKTMRKLKQGDVLQFTTFANAGTNSEIMGCFQFFCKT